MSENSLTSQMGLNAGFLYHKRLLCRIIIPNYMRIAGKFGVGLYFLIIAGNRMNNLRIGLLFLLEIIIFAYSHCNMKNTIITTSTFLFAAI